MKLIDFFNAPYPFYESTRQSVKICVSIGVFIAAFCYLFRPFGLHEVPALGLLGYGLVSFMVCGFYIILLPLLFSSKLNSKHWKVYKEILWILCIVTSLAIANYHYSGIFFPGKGGSWKVFLFVLSVTAIIALIPAISIILYKQLVVYKRIIEEIKRIDAKLFEKTSVLKRTTKPRKQIVLHSENDKDSLTIYEDCLLYICSAGNYVEIFYLTEDQVTKKLIRNNISKIETRLKKMTNIIRCHRSYMVNLDKIEHISGNLQGYQLQISSVENAIPVSRSYTKKIKRYFN